MLFFLPKQSLLTSDYKINKILIRMSNVTVSVILEYQYKYGFFYVVFLF